VKFHSKYHDLRSGHFFYKYNWCHVIDTILQLYTIVDQGIELKSVSMRSWRWTSLRLPRNPRIAARVLLKRANLSFVLMYVMTDAYWLPAFFNYFFRQSFVDSGAFWCHRTTFKTRAWM